MLEKVMGAIHGAVEGWRGTSPAVRDIQKVQADYAEKWALYDGTMFSDLLTRNPYRDDPAIYRNTKLLWKHVESIVDFYAGVIYQGALAAQAPAEGNEVGGAIPFITQSSDKNAELMAAIVELFIAWNWQQQMSLRPLYGSALGDVLTEVTDDTGRRFVYPQIVWPGHVVDVEIDYVGNVQSYVIEYMASEKRNGTIETFKFRKEVDKESFRYFRDDRPHDEYGDGPVVPNVYGFVPAIWDRHRVGTPGSVRGRSAIDGTRQALMQVNSIFSHAFDFQRKAFFMPPMVAGKWPRKGMSDIDATPDDDGDGHAQETGFVPVPDGASLLQPQFDVGKTREMLQDIQAGILAENPEAQFYQQLRDMAQVTAPAAERLMGDVKTRVDLARAGYDSNTVKLFQMAIAIAGFRVNESNGPWHLANGKRLQLSARQMAFARFDLESYGRGELDMSIAQRPIVPTTESERLTLIAQKEALMTPWGLEQAGLDSEAAKSILDSRTVADAGIF